MENKSIIFTLQDSETLLKKVISELAEKEHGILEGKLRKQEFSDEEICVDFIDSVRGKRVYLLASPTNSDKIMELVMAVDAAMRASAKEIIPILTYYPYSRSDKKDQSRGPIGGKVIANFLQKGGATSVITFDLHAPQIEGFFDIPTTHMSGKYIFVDEIYKLGVEDMVLASPDSGGTKRVKHVRDYLLKKYGVDVPMILMDKTRKAANIVEKIIVIGDVKGKKVVMVDDMCDTAGTMCKGAEALLEKGATEVYGVVTHGLFTGPAHDRIKNSKFTQFICADTIPLKEENTKIKVISIAKELSKVIKAVDDCVSIEEVN